MTTAQPASKLSVLDSSGQPADPTYPTNWSDREGILTAHPQFLKFRESLVLAHEAYFGTGGYLDGTNLIRYFREDQEEYDERRALSFYVNFFKSIVQVFSNAIFSQGPTRKENVKGLKLDQAFRSVHGDRNLTLKHICDLAHAMSVCMIQIDRPKRQMSTLADRLAAPPYVNVINPLSMPDWELDGDEFAWCKILEWTTTGRDPLKPAKPTRALRIWERDRWTLYEQESSPPSGVPGKWRLTEEGFNEFGYVPIIPFWPDSTRETNSLYGSTDSFHLARIGNRIFNAHSEQVTNIRENVFDQLAFPKKENAKVEMGPKRVLFYDPQFGGEPRWLTPDGTATKTLQEHIMSLVVLMHQMKRLDAESGLSPSSVSATQRVYIGEEAEKVVRRLAQQGQDMEIRVSKVIADLEGFDPMMLDDPERFKITWPIRYDASVLADNIVNRFVQMAGLNFPSDTMNREKAKYIARNMIPLEDSKLVQIEDEIEESDGIITNSAANNQTQVPQSTVQAGENDQAIQTPATQHQGLDSEARGNVTNEVSHEVA